MTAALQFELVSARVRARADVASVDEYQPVAVR
jgi:hypothetical protein